MLIQHVCGSDHVALGLGHLLAVRVHDESRNGGVSPRFATVLQGRAKHGGEEPGANDVLTLGAQVEGEDQVPQVLITFPTTSKLGSQARGCPRVHDIDFTLESAGDASLSFGVTGGNIGGWINWKLLA